MKKLLNFSSQLVFSLFIVSCGDTQDSKLSTDDYTKLPYQLQFTDNPIKNQAANFITSNAPYHHFAFGAKSRAYIKEINEDFLDVNLLSNRLESLKLTEFPPLRTIDDASVLKEVFLRNDISLTYNTLSKVIWRSSLSNEVIYDYLLPYRIGDEPIDNWDWRKFYYDTYIKANGTSVFRKDIRSAVNEVHTWLIAHRKKDFAVKFGAKSLDLPPLPISTADKLKVGSCHELALVSSAFLRALSIPVTFDFVPNYVNVNSGHEWSAVILDSTNVIPFDIENNQLGNYKKENFKLSKVYRKTFQPDEKRLSFQTALPAGLPPFLYDPCLKDVTREYLKTISLSVHVNKSAGDNQIAFLSVFNNSDWVPVDFGHIKNGKAFFGDVALTSGVYLLTAQIDDNQVPLTDPFLLDDNGKIHFYRPDVKNTRTIKVDRKFPIDLFSADKYAKKMTGGIFQVTNDPSFENAKTVAVIEKKPFDNTNVINLNAIKGKYRYIRYYAPNGSNGNIAELSVYSTLSDQPIKGKVIGTEGSWANTPSKTKLAAFDGNPLTFFDAPKPNHNWVGLDLGYPLSLKKLTFHPRTDMNGIYLGNIYELFFWNNGWKSLGSITAEAPYLEYENVPKNALLLLKNLSKGKEERIFTYENNHQVWW